MSYIVVAPFSNSDIRDWPVEHYAALLGLLLARLPAETLIYVTGAPNQKLRACEVVREHDAARVINACGAFSWREMLDLLPGAACIISNNSGIGHLGGYMGVPTVCIFGGSHQRREWRPLGPTVVIVSRSIGCSPCHLDHGSSSPYRKACLRELEPAVVADAAVANMARVDAMRFAVIATPFASDRY